MHSVRYTHALDALAHALLLNPQNPFHVLQAAETAYTIGDIPLAIKFYLVVIEMTDGDDKHPGDSVPTGISVRAWYGVKTVGTVLSLCYILSSRA